MNTYKDFVILHGITLDPRGVKLYVDWLLSCEPDSQAYKIGEAMRAAIDNYCDNLNFEGECRITNALCNHCKEVKTMTNREKLLNTNIYDLLMHINNQIPYRSLNCIIDYIEGKNRDCIENGKCGECIQQYLNEESKNTTIGG